MIGDIVSYNGAICRITSIECFGNLVGIENETICELVSDAELSPIPLTEEILKANGFRRFVETRKRMRKDNPSEICIHRKIRFLCVQNPDTTSVHYISIVLNGNTIIMYPTDKGEWVKSINLKTPYVHELQHALRLCGLTELADNFKV